MEYVKKAIRISIELFDVLKTEATQEGMSFNGYMTRLLLRRREYDEEAVRLKSRINGLIYYIVNMCKNYREE